MPKQRSIQDLMNMISSVQERQGGTARAAARTMMGAQPSTPNPNRTAPALTPLQRTALAFAPDVRKKGTTQEAIAVGSARASSFAKAVKAGGKGDLSTYEIINRIAKKRKESHSEVIGRIAALKGGGFRGTVIPLTRYLRGDIDLYRPIGRPDSGKRLGR